MTNKKNKISFSQAEKKTFGLNLKGFPGPGEYDLAEKSILMTKKNANKIAFSFSREKKMVLPKIYKTERSELTNSLKTLSMDENSLRSLFDFHGKNDKNNKTFRTSNSNFSKFEEISVLDKYIKTENEEKLIQTNQSLNSAINQSSHSLRTKLNKSETKSNFSRLKRPMIENKSQNSTTRKQKKNISLLKSQISSMTQNSLKKLFKLKQKNLLNRMESSLIRKKTNENPLKKYMETEISKKINEKIEKKMIKEIFLLSSDAEEKKKNRGFTKSIRKLEFLNIPSKEKLPGPGNYTIKRDLSIYISFNFF